jgi:molybdopterin-dependent oxidoreductase alpha subunit
MAWNPLLWASARPAGFGQTKPAHYREMARIAWQNRRELPFAWRILRDGACDGCALGTSGLRDWTMRGTHLCMVRLELMGINTAPPLDPERLADVSRLEGRTSRQLRSLGRLAQPMLRRKGEKGFRVVSWEEACEEAAARIRGADPRRLAIYLTSRGILNEHYYAAQKAARFLGTNNVDNSARLCHAASTTAMKRALGAGATTCSYSDWIGADLIVFFGSNAANNQPVSMKYLYYARQAGTKVALVNPYDEPGMERYWVPSVVESAVFGTKMADEWFPVHTGGDLAFLLGVFRILCAEGWIDREFIDRSTTGFAEARAAADAIPFERLERDSGVPRARMQSFAEMLRDARNAVFVWSMGVTQHRHGTQTVEALLNVGLARHYVGREKNGLMPIRGHSGVQGGAEVGCVPGLGEAARRRFEEVWGFPVPDAPGLTAAEQVEAAAQGRIDVFWVVGGNFLETLPDPARSKSALARVGTRIHQDVMVSSQMLIEPADAALLFPATTRYESPGGGTETSTERRVIFSPEIPGRRIAGARPEWEIFAEVARRARPERAGQLRIESSEQLRAEIGRAVASYAGIERLAHRGDNFQLGGPRLFADGRFSTPDGRARFRALALPEPAQAGAEFTLSTRRGRQFNSMVHHGKDPLTDADRQDVLVSEADAAGLGLRNGDEVRIASASGEIRARVRVAPIKPGNLQVHWPEGLPLLSAGNLDPQSFEPDYNARVSLEKLLDSSS